MNSENSEQGRPPNLYSIRPLHHFLLNTSPINTPAFFKGIKDRMWCIQGQIFDPSILLLHPPM